MRTTSRRRSGTRRVLKWITTAFCVVIIFGFLASLRWHLALSISRFMINIGNGGILLIWGGSPSRTAVTVMDDPLWVDLVAPDLAWLPILARRPSLTSQGRIVSLGPIEAVGVPIWLVFATFALLSGFLWYRDRHFPKGCCRVCGYDLTGNVSGICPECGEEM